MKKIILVSIFFLIMGKCAKVYDLQEMTNTKNCLSYLSKTFPEYDCFVNEEIGKGAFSYIYLVALKSDKKKKAVLKVADCQDSDTKTKAKSEFEILKKLNHENLIQLKSDKFFEIEDKCIHLQEFGDLGNIENLITWKDELLNNEVNLLKLLFQISKGLKELKDNKIIHADIKPSNLVVFQNETVKIIDYNLSIEGTGFTFTRGSLPYSDPEILEYGLTFKYSNFDYSVDIYSLGVTFYQMTFGHLPFFHQRGGATLSEKVLRCHYNMEKTSPFIAFLIFHMMARKKEKRPTIEQLLKWIVFAIRWTQATTNISETKELQKYNDLIEPDKFKDNIFHANYEKAERSVELGKVEGENPFPENGWKAMGIDVIPDKNSPFLDLENSGLLTKFDWGLASYIKNTKITQSTKLQDIPYKSDQIPTELPKDKDFFGKIGDFFNKKSYILVV